MCRYMQETILLKKISKNVKGVVVVPKLGIRGYMISQKLFIIEA